MDEVQQTQEVTTQETAPAAPEVVNTPAVQKADGGEAITPVVQAYTPNLKFKVMEKEHQFDDWVKPIIKDAETEKKVKELYEKAYGLDYVKPKYEAEKTRAEELHGKYQTLYSDVADAMQSKNEGDLDSFFQKVGISNDKIYDWILAKINRNNMPPDQRQVYEDLEAKQRNERITSRQMESMQTQYQQMAAKHREMEVDYGLLKPEINDIKSRYDAANGNGAFKAFVAEQGVLHFNLHGEDPSAETAISMALKKLGDAWKNTPVQPQVSTASGEKQLPVIPNVSGKNVSPTRKAVRSIDEIRKLAADMSG